MKPAESVKLLQRMEDAAWSVATTQFLNNKSYRAKTLHPDSHILQGGFSGFRRLGVAAGMNFPPSQFQLHLQYMLLPLLPSHFALFKSGNHFTDRRFFPLEYLYTVLRSLANRPLLQTSRRTSYVRAGPNTCFSGCWCIP